MVKELSRKLKYKYYVVKKGRCPGVYTSWRECCKQTYKYNKAEYKCFVSQKEMADYIDEIWEETEPDLIAYVDGSFNSDKFQYGYGCVFISQNKIIGRINGKGKNKEWLSMRNVAGEITGALEAIYYAIENGYNHIQIYYDYEGIEKWATKKWKRNKLGTIQYCKEIERLQEYIDISFVKVKAHSGIEYNEIADRLAKDSVGNR